VVDKPVEDSFDIDDVGEVAVLVEGCALELNLDNVVMGMGAVLCPPITAKQEVLCNEVAFNGDGIHHPPLKTG
jgi:hypothetical protein